MFRNIFVKTVKPPIKSESPAQMLKRVEAEADAERVLMRLADEKRERDGKISAERIAALRSDAITAKTESTIKREALFEGVINYAPLVIISGLAITGQYGSFSEYLKPTFHDFSGVIAALMALGLESIALFLGLHALKALRRKDSAAGLLLSATLIAAIVAYLNFDHYRLDNGAASIASYAFALFSFVAPFLWRVKIRSDHRNELASNGEIDVRGLKLPRVMWAMHPIKSYSVYRHAAWTGQRDVEMAVKEWESETADKPVKIKGVNAQDLDMLYGLIENLKIDLQETSDETPEIPNPQRRELSAGTTFEIERFMKHPKWNDGVAIYAASVDSGNPMKVSDLATELGMTNRVLAGKIKDFVINGRDRDSVGHDGSDLAAETA